MNWAASYLVSRRALEGLNKMPSFYRKKCGVRKLSAKEKTELFLDQDIFFSGGGEEEKGKVFLSCRLSLLSVGLGGG